MIVIGLTGSVGMGKTTTAGFFTEAGLPVHDADAAVHALYSGRAVAPVEEAFPGVAVDGVIDRNRLSKALSQEPANFRKLETIVHPMVLEERRTFLRKAEETGIDIAVLDVPLLFETGADSDVDFTVVASCDPAIQRERVLARPDMTVEKFETILKRQLPDSEKRARADYIVDTGAGMEKARAAVLEIIADVRRKQSGI